MYEQITCFCKTFEIDGFQVFLETVKSESTIIYYGNNLVTRQPGTIHYFIQGVKDTALSLRVIQLTFVIAIFKSVVLFHSH